MIPEYEIPLTAKDLRKSDINEAANYASECP